MAKTEEQAAASQTDKQAEQLKAEKQAKMKALQAAMTKIEKDFGKGSIMRMGDEKVENVEVIPTGSIGLDLALGVGGYPRGRIIEIYGPESSGKTTLAITAIAEAQKRGGIAAFINAEHAFDRFYAEKLGVDVDNLWISQPDNGEQALQIADQLISSSAVDILVVDSVAALTPKKEIEGDMGDSAVGLQARLMSQAHRHDLENQHVLHLHQPATREDWRDVWQPRDDNRRQRSEILFKRAHRHSPRDESQGRRQRIWQPRPRESGEKQGRPPIPQSRV